jgi:hypothetical protein
VVATTEPRLFDAEGRPTFGLNFYAVNKRGDVGGAAMFAGARYAAWDGSEARHHDAAYLYERDR